MIYTRENTIRILDQYKQSLLAAKDGEQRLKIIKRINELQEDLSNES